MLEEDIKAAVYSSVSNMGGATSHKQTHASPPLIHHPFDSFILFNASPQLGGVIEVMQFFGGGWRVSAPPFSVRLGGFQGVGVKSEHGYSANTMWRHAPRNLGQVKTADKDVSDAAVEWHCMMHHMHTHITHTWAYIITGTHLAFGKWLSINVYFKPELHKSLAKPL